MSYRIWWLLAFWALAIGVAIELEAPAAQGRDEPGAEASAASAPVAARPAASKSG